MESLGTLIPFFSPCLSSALLSKFGTFKVHPQAFIVHKGINPVIDSYSAFFDNKKLSHTEMEAYLRSKNITDVYVCGIAYDVCVGKLSTLSKK